MPIVPIELPQVGESVVEGIIDRWLKKPGDRVEKYDPLVEVITDKVNMEMPAPFGGVLTRILVQEGATIPFGAVIAEMDTEDAEALAGAPKPPPERASSAGTVGVLVESRVSVGPTGASGGEEAAPEPAPPARRGYSPVVMKLAQERGVDLSRVRGTGINGRVTKKDVLDFIEASTAATPVAGTPAPPPVARDDEEIVELTPVRRIIAQNMAMSASQIPTAWTMIEVDVTNLLELRQATRERLRAEGQDITALPFVIKVVAVALKEHPYLNASWRDGRVALKKGVHVGVAVAAPTGLVVPVIRNADSLSISDINKALRSLVSHAREGSLSLDEVHDGTFTVNNAGALGTLVSKPIINFPQAGILTTESTQRRPVVVGDDIVARSMMNMCLSFDHRIIDGYEAAAFLRSVKSGLEGMGPGAPIS